jgi:hypothetical protein
VLHLVLPLLAHTRNPARSPCTNVAEDHPLRRPLALARDKRRSPVSEIRCRYALGQRQLAAHPRRSARLRVDALRPTTFTRRRASASCATEAMAPAAARRVNRPVRRPSLSRRYRKECIARLPRRTQSPGRVTPAHPPAPEADTKQPAIGGVTMTITSVQPDHRDQAATPVVAFLGTGRMGGPMAANLVRWPRTFTGSFTPL